MPDDDAFHTTRWTLVRNAAVGTPEARQALGELCAGYYAPVVAFLRRTGREEDAARELAHEFFAHVLERPSLGGAEPERGRFRSYLLGALKHFLGHRREREAREKRGGGRETLPLSIGPDGSPELDPADRQTLPPDREFDRQWAMHVVRVALGAVEAEWTAAGGLDEFALLKPHLNGDAAHGALGALARAQGINEATLRSALHRLRRSFRHAVKAQVAPTLATREDVEDEMRALFLALADG
jgi:DNA-directed RNA polymerase specialized sigma24 family protein